MRLVSLLDNLQKLLKAIGEEEAGNPEVNDFSKIIHSIFNGFKDKLDQLEACIRSIESTEKSKGMTAKLFTALQPAIKEPDIGALGKDLGHTLDLLNLAITAKA